MEITILVVLCVVLFFMGKTMRLPVGRVPIMPAEQGDFVPPEVNDVRMLSAETKQRPFDHARTDHLASLKARVAYFAGGNTRVRCELDQTSGLWRTWCDAASYEKAALRATWRTESGAWRLLLRALTGNEFGGVWMAVTK